MRRDGVTLTLIGAQELERALLELPERLQKSTLDRALKQCAEPILNAAQDNARAVGKTGKNASKIVISSKLSRRQRRGVKKAEGERIIYIGVRPSPVAHLIEFGTGPRYTKAGAYRGQMTATPFMRPAWDSNWRPALDEFGTILGREIERTATRLARRKAKRAGR